MKREQRVKIFVQGYLRAASQMTAPDFYVDLSGKIVYINCMSRYFNR